jgi:hypothetical protein
MYNCLIDNITLKIINNKSITKDTINLTIIIGQSENNINNISDISNISSINY